MNKNTQEVKTEKRNDNYRKAFNPDIYSKQETEDDDYRPPTT